jgi:hypothetical protein
MHEKMEVLTGSNMLHLDKYKCIQLETLDTTNIA